MLQGCEFQASNQGLIFPGTVPIPEPSRRQLRVLVEQEARLSPRKLQRVSGVQYQEPGAETGM